MTDERLILSTASSREEAKTMRLAACVNILGPVSSVYHWRGEVEHSEEFLLLIKSTGAQFLPIQAAVRELHSYKVPKLISFAVESGLESYLSWIAASVRE